MRILDLFCGEGGAAMGYHQALEDASNVSITGVDIRPMSRYPFNFIQCDALTLDYKFLDGFDFIHASPPCKSYTRLYKFATKDIDKSVLPRTLVMLEATGKPYVIENVPQAPIRADIQLSGDMFNLTVVRKRIFQTNIIGIPKYPKPSISLKPGLKAVTVAGNSCTLEAASNAMSIDWMSKKGISESIPPAYTKWIMQQIIGVLP